MNETAKKVWEIAKKGISILAFALLLTVSFQSFKTNKDKDYIPSIFNYVYLNVLSGSMEPEFSPNDLIIGKKVKDTSVLKEGDIITYRDDQALVTHRIVEIKDNGASFVTKGDANETVDSRETPAEAVVAKLTTHIPSLGYLLSKFYNFKFQALLYLILMYCILSELYKEVKKVKQESNEEILNETKIN